MGGDPAINSRGDGTKPTTDGGIENIGAGGKFDTGKSAIGESNVGPAPTGGQAGRPKDVETTRKDDSVPFNLRGDPEPETNVEPGKPPTDI